MDQTYDIIVIGGGHAGIEAAWAAATLGASTALVTMQRDAIGRLSCNPAIGGLGKGQIVREIDALGGLMGLATDRAGIQFRMLNRSKGPAVRAPRAQCDRRLYPLAVQDLLGAARNLRIIEGVVQEIQTRPADHTGGMSHGPSTFGAKRDSDQQDAPGTPRHRAIGVTLSDTRTLTARAVVLTTGTFLRGLMHCGTTKTAGGRAGEQAAAALSASLERLGFGLARFKTGTPPRVHRDSIDYAACDLQPGDELPTPFSMMTDVLHQRQLPCWITWTNARVHQHIRQNLHRAPMYSGQIESTGPRYCPSIEDKVVRFADKPRHQIFLEPEGYDDERVYCNGISTSLPIDVQEAFLREVPGLHHARILQPGYAVEYDCIPSHQTKPSLETKLVEGLFVAGQINGTSGYEEAAAQGLVAGVNAVQTMRGDEPLVLGRDQAYIGVMIDDLVTRPPSEPYRMFTSRAEYRLLLRADNADRRLTPIGRKLGLVDDRRWARYERRDEALRALESLCRKGAAGGVPLVSWLRRPDADVTSLALALGRLTDRAFGVDDLRQTLIDAQYAGYIERQSRQIHRFRRLEAMPIPAWVDYSAMPQLRLEARECLARHDPRTLGQAGRIAGVNPADVTVLWVYLSGLRSPRRDRQASHPA